MKWLFRDEKQEQIVDNLKAFFDTQRASQNDARIRIAIMEAAEHGDEEEWLASVPALMGTGDGELPKKVSGDTQVEKSNFDEMVKLAMQRFATVSRKRR
jgi:hypothetical protein